MRILVVVPFALDAEGVRLRREQLTGLDFGSSVEFDFVPIAAGPSFDDSYHDWLLGDLSIFHAGMHAERDGYDAVCVDTVGDNGVSALRSVLRIPVIGPGRASYMSALMVADSFSVLTVWEPWISSYKKTLKESGVADKCKSILSTTGYMPDLSNLLGGKVDEVSAELVTLGQRAIDEHGAEAIVFGSTTMYEAYDHVAAALPVPVINPGPLSYFVAASHVQLGLTHGLHAFEPPRGPKLAMIDEMMRTAVSHDRVDPPE